MHATDGPLRFNGLMYGRALYAHHNATQRNATYTIAHGGTFPDPFLDERFPWISGPKCFKEIKACMDDGYTETPHGVVLSA